MVGPPWDGGKDRFRELAVLDENNSPVPNGTSGTLWFKTATEFAYHNDPEKTREATSADGTHTTVGDVGYVDDDGFLYLTDRKTFMIISGGVNIYPQECEDLLISPPLGCRCGGLRCTQRRSWRRGQGGGAAHARHR